MLNLMVIEGDKAYENKLTPVKFQTHHIVEMLMYFIQKVDLDGSTKLTIKFAKRPVNEDVYNCSKSFRVSWYYIDPEKIQKGKPGQDRDRFYLELIANVLKDIAKLNHCDNSVYQIIEDAMNKVRECDFTLRIPIKKLAKTSNDKIYKAAVWRILCPQGEKWQAEIKGKDRSVLWVDLTKDYTHVSQEGLYFKAEWQEDRFVIFEKLGRVLAVAIPAEKVLQLYSLKGLREVVELIEVK